VWNPYSEEGSGFLDNFIEGLLGDAERTEEAKNKKVQETMWAMDYMKKSAIDDVRFEEYQEKLREQREERIKKKELLERPKRAVEDFWGYVNAGLRMIAHSRPKFAEAIAQFNQASALMANEIQFLVPATQDYRMMMTELMALARTYAYICRALEEFRFGGNYTITFDYAMADLERCRNTIPNIYASLRSMCEAFISEGQKRDTTFSMAVKLFPHGPDSGALLLIVMALVLNHKEKKYESLVDELYEKFRSN
jgi:hypothetical protein